MINLKHILLFSLAQLLWTTGIKAQNDTTLRLSLADAQQYAIDHFYQSKNALLDVESARKKIWETTAIGLPQASAKISGSYSPTLSASIEQFSSLSTLGQWMYGADQSLFDLTGDPNFGHIPNPGTPESVSTNDMKWSLNGTLTVSQLLFSGSYLVGLQSAKVYHNISVLNNQKTDLDVKENVSNSYFNVLIARENRTILDSTYANLTKTLEDLKALNKQGLIEETDVDQLQISVTNVKTSLDLITRMADIAEKLLKTQLGVDLDAPIELTDDLKTQLNATSYEQLLMADFILENNIDYRMLDNQVKASELLLKLNKSTYLPDLAAFYQYQKEFNKNAFSFTPPHILGVGMNIPIFSSGSRMAKVSQSEIELLKAKNGRDQLGNSIKLNFYNSKSLLISANEKFDSQIQNLDLSKRIYNKALIKYKNGVISSTDLAQIQNQYFTALSNYYNSLQELIAAKNKLENLLSKSE